MLDFPINTLVTNLLRSFQNRLIERNFLQMNLNFLYICDGLFCWMLQIILCFYVAGGDWWFQKNYVAGDDWNCLNTDLVCKIMPWYELILTNNANKYYRGCKILLKIVFEKIQIKIIMKIIGFRKDKKTFLRGKKISND